MSSTNIISNDKSLRVEVLERTPRPNLLCYLAMHQDYSAHAVYNDIDKLSKLSESELGNRLVRRCIKYSHYGVLEHPGITFNVINFPHSVMVQARTHRVACSFDVSSQRYCGQQIIKMVGEWETTSAEEDKRFNEIEKIFYFRPAGKYFDREGNKYNWGSNDIALQKIRTIQACVDYYAAVHVKKMAPEHCRDMLPQGIRQNFVVTFNARSLLHFCDLRLSKDAQIEIQYMAELILSLFAQWMPEIHDNYMSTRAYKNKLAP